MAVKPLTGLKGLLQKTKLVLPENNTPTSKPDSRPKQKAAQNAIDNSALKRLTRSLFGLVVKKNVIKVVPVSSNDDSEEEPPQVRKDQSNNSWFKDMEVDSCHQYVPPRQWNSSPEQDMDHVPGRLRNVPPRRQWNSSPEQDMDHVPGRLHNSSPETQSLPPGTDIDDASSLFNDNLTDEEDEEDVDGIPDTHSSTRTRQTAPSKRIKEPKQSLSNRVQKFAKEVPKFKAPALKKNEKLPVYGHLKPSTSPPSVSQQLISMRTQSSAMQEVLGKAVTTSIGLFLLQDVYPDVAVQEFMLQNALVSAATEVGLDEMAEQLCAPDERKWRKPLADYVFNRVVHVHSDFKKHVESIILDTRPPPEFDEMVVPATDVPVTDAAEGAEKPPIITKLVERPYIPNYTQDTSLELRGGAYKHPAIIAALCSMFTGPTSPGRTFLSAFFSSLDEEKYPDSEPEVPMSMLAFAATAVHFCLSKWATGLLHPGEFKRSKAWSEYHKNVELLQRMQKDDVLRYHDLMSNMLTQAINLLECRSNVYEYYYYLRTNVVSEEAQVLFI
ncbi:hypothetical protein BT96DRAFT_950074 [Gymnopus androsaceus JB14]|uniref:DUF6532 domain-containing protein n=1 Tax=Gymnopus androsaceus JB14 TaxID=1447944 RepID=A0A6A4GHK8_9AGAR|nr:hypothetical protein BT96DRAFT_950074 [Gymnopus androsaceus JB14]